MNAVMPLWVRVNMLWVESCDVGIANLASDLIVVYSGKSLHLIAKLGVRSLGSKPLFSRF